MKVTIAALVKASKKNGFPWAKKGGFNTTYYTPHRVFACVVGQGVENLGGNKFPETSEEASDIILSLLSEIYSYNDNDAESYEDAVKFMENRLRGYGRYKVEIGDAN